MNFDGRLRLQIRTEPKAAGTLQNSLVNNDGDAGSYGWTRTSGTTWNWTANAVGPINVTRTTAVTQFASTTAPAAAGNIVQVSMNMRANAHYTSDGLNRFAKLCSQTRVGTQTMNGTTVVATTWTAWHTHTVSETSFTQAPADVTIPATGVNGVRVVYEVALLSDGTTHGSVTVGGSTTNTTSTYSHTVTQNGTMYINTGAPLAPAVVGTDWLDIWGSTGNIETDRDELGLGTMHADIYDSTLDPKTNTQMHKGATVRLQALEAGGTWANLFVGNVTNISTQYTKTGKRRPHISLDAVDMVSTLANTIEDDGKPSLSGLAQHLAQYYPNIPFAYNGVLSSPNVSWTAVGSTYINPEQSLLNSISVTRDSVGGYVWVDKNGTLQMYDGVSLPKRGGQIGFMDTFDPNAATRTNAVTNPNNVGGTWTTDTAGVVVPTSGLTTVGSSSVDTITWPDGTTHNQTRYANEFTYGVDVKNNDASKSIVAMGTVYGSGAVVGFYPDTAVTIAPGQTKRLTFNLNQRKTNAATNGNDYNQNITNGGTTWAPRFQVWTTDPSGTFTAATYSRAMIESRGAAVSGVWQVPENGYFDGTTVGASWTGTANASTSTQDATRFVSYSDINAGFSLSDVINSIVVKVVGFNGVGETVETSYGPFQDANSILKYGLFQQEVTVTGSVTPATYAASVLAKTATPTVKVDNVTMPVKDERSFSKALLADLYMDVEVSYGTVFSGETMITNVKHSITANINTGVKWEMEVGFRNSNAVAQFVGSPPAIAPAYTPIPRNATGADITTATTTYITNGPQVTVEAGKTYYFRALGTYNSSLTTIGLGLRMNGTATLTNMRGVSTVWGATTSASTPFKTTLTGLTTANARTTTFAAGTGYQWEVEGVIVVNAGGTFRVEFNSSAAGTITIQRGAVLLLTQVA